MKVSKQIPAFKHIEISDTQQEEFLASLQQGNGFGPDYENDLGKLEVLSLIGNDKAWDILKNYEVFTGTKTDGVIAEQWLDALVTVQWIREM